MGSEVDYDVPCINCDRTDCNGETCMDDDPEDLFLRDVWREDYCDWIERRHFNHTPEAPDA